MAKPTRAQRFRDAIEQIESATEDIATLRDELQEWRDGIPENMQDGGKSAAAGRSN